MGRLRREAERLPARSMRPGHRCVRFASTDSVRGLNVVGVVEKANNETLYVATEGEPYPVQAQSDTGQGALDFLEWDEPVDVQAPPLDQVVDLDRPG
jgi:hypothetical protein